MRVIYLCMRGMPEDSDYFTVVDYFKDFSPEQRPMGVIESKSIDQIYFADVSGSSVSFGFFDFAVAFLSNNFLENDNAVRCLSSAFSMFPNLISIDLYDNLSPESIDIAKKYSKKILSMEAGKHFLKEELPGIAAVYGLDEIRINEVIENDGYSYLDNCIEDLCKREKKYINLGLISFVGCFLLLIVNLYIAAVLLIGFFRVDIDFSRALTVILGVAILSAAIIAAARLFFLLGKALIVESIRANDRAHAMRFGKFYLQLYKEKFSWFELKDVLKNWNIDQGSVFGELDSKELESVKLSDLLSLLKK